MAKGLIVFSCISLMVFQFSLGEVSAGLTIENILKEFSAFVNADGRSGFPASSRVNEEEMLLNVRAASDKMDGPVGFIGDFLEANENNGFCKYKQGNKGEDGCSVDFEVRFLIEAPEGEMADIGKTLSKYFDAVVDMNKKKKFWEISTTVHNTVESDNAKQYVVKQYNRMRSSNAYAVYDYMVKRTDQDTAVMYGVRKDISKLDDRELLNKLFINEADQKMYMDKDANTFAGMTLVKRVEQGGRQYYAFYSIYSAELKGESECKVVKGGFISLGEITMIENECNKAVAGYVRSTVSGNMKKPRFTDSRDLMKELGMMLPPQKWVDDEDESAM